MNLDVTTTKPSIFKVVFALFLFVEVYAYKMFVVVVGFFLCANSHKAQVKYCGVHKMVFRWINFYLIVFLFRIVVQLNVYWVFTQGKSIVFRLFYVFFFFND